MSNMSKEWTSLGIRKDVKKVIEKDKETMVKEGDLPVGANINDVILKLSQVYRKSKEEDNDRE